MQETRRLMQAAAALSQALQASSVPHAFYGSILVALLANNTLADQMVCIVQGNSTHPFRLVRQALISSQDLSTTSSPWSDRLHVTYHRFIPPIEIEILTAGEQGPRRLDASTVMTIRGVPFLSISESIRAKLKCWTIRQSDSEASEITYLMNRYWNRVDINRIPEHDMVDFVAAHTEAAPGWTALKRKYGV